MAIILSTGRGGIPVNFSTGMVIAFKSTRFDIAGNLGAKEVHLDLCTVQQGQGYHLPYDNSQGTKPSLFQ